MVFLFQQSTTASFKAWINYGSLAKETFAFIKSENVIQNVCSCSNKNGNVFKFSHFKEIYWDSIYFTKLS